ncbi:MAG: ZmpA/ZmpB/ZmpC family metallo-endopeptidase-related protein, partial [Bacteriovorax sp.]
IVAIPAGSSGSLPVSLNGQPVAGLTISSIPNVVACDQNATPFGGGNGDPDSPYQICSMNQLDKVRNNLSASYILMADLDASQSSFSSNFPRIGTTDFSGIFEGNQHAISNLRMSKSLFFGIADGAEIRNLRLDFVNVTAGTTSCPAADLSILAGSSSGRISQVHLSGSVTQNTNNSQTCTRRNVAAFLSGTNNGIIEDSIGEVTIRVQGGSSSIQNNVGFAKTNNGTIRNSYFTAPAGQFGGLNVNAITSTSGSDLEGVFYNKSRTVNGAAGSNASNIIFSNASSSTNVVYVQLDKSLNGVNLGTMSIGYMGLNSAITDPKVYAAAGWDFTNIWAMGTTGPILKWEAQALGLGPNQAQAPIPLAQLFSPITVQSGGDLSTDLFAVVGADGSVSIQMPDGGDFISGMYALHFANNNNYGVENVFATPGVPDSIIFQSGDVQTAGVGDYLTALVLDAFGNAVADGTEVMFQIEHFQDIGGLIATTSSSGSPGIAAMPVTFPDAGSYTLNLSSGAATLPPITITVNP